MKLNIDGHDLLGVPSGEFDKEIDEILANIEPNMQKKAINQAVGIRMSLTDISKNLVKMAESLDRRGLAEAAAAVDELHMRTVQAAARPVPGPLLDDKIPGITIKVSDAGLHVRTAEQINVLIAERKATANDIIFAIEEAAYAQSDFDRLAQIKAAKNDKLKNAVKIAVQMNLIR